MTQEQQVQFLKKTIRELGSAILSNLDDLQPALFFPCLIRTDCVDDKGHVWFVLNSKKYPSSLFAKPIPVRLQFFAPGKKIRMDITGVASLAGERDKAPEQLHSDAEQQVALIKVKIHYAEYADVKTPQSASNIFSMLYYKWLNRNQSTHLLVLR